MKVAEIGSILEEFAPLYYQESYDNSGLLVGDPNAVIESALLCIDVTEQIIDEAISNDHKLIISHHPLIFKGLKSITDHNSIERIVVKAIKNDIAIYAAHTNLDSVNRGVSAKMCDKLGIKNYSILSPLPNSLLKLVVFVPNSHEDVVRTALFEVGAGHIGNYDCCSYNLNGRGTFRAGEGTNPFVGKQGKLHTEEEVRIEAICPKQIISTVIKALVSSHPYEEPAYDIYPLENSLPQAGLGMIGKLDKAMPVNDFLVLLKSTFNASSIRYTAPVKDHIEHVAVCGGSGFSLMYDAIANKADIFITADIKYHQFFEAEGKITLADIGHYESEQFTVEIVQELLSEKIPTFATQLSKFNSNPINYI
ncbi:MAG: Nif3-like dinuclear metal center hexameric protein [Prevotellaceae bacterium]|nr:Nif3-like dinuclear metal center hexameric protein [Prevotellaceae bacterium]